MNDGSGGTRHQRRARAGLLATVMTGAALLAAACSGGGSPSAGSSSSPAPGSVQAMDAFAACMRGHGVANFYFTKKTGTPSPGNGVVLVIRGYEVTGVNPQTSQFQAGMKACQHVLGLHPPSGGLQHKQFVQMLKSAACMRSHGYPDWPDPSTGPNGQGIMVPGPPAGVDVNSPQFQKVAKACGEPVP